MFGAIAGDIIGAPYEFSNLDRKNWKDFKLFSKGSDFTDDSVLTVATADCILNNGDFGSYYKKYYIDYPERGYGAMFSQWGSSIISCPYNSFGNGSAMRVSPVAYAYGSIEEVLFYARASAEVTHNHPEGIKGAQAAAAAVFLAKTGANKKRIKDYTEKKFQYDLDEPVESIITWYAFNESCQKTVPQAIRVFLESENFEDAIRRAIYIGGDSDTIACITGAISESYYGGVPPGIKEEILNRLDPRLATVMEKFYKKFQ